MSNGYRQNGGRPSFRKKAWTTVTAVVLASAGTVGVMKLAGFGGGQGTDPTSLAGLHLGRVDTVNLTLYNQAVWLHHWSASGKHTVKIVVAGTAGHPIVPVDGFAVLG